jgi:tetratricopeptide (TPR) repeat protein
MPSINKFTAPLAAICLPVFLNSTVAVCSGQTPTSGDAASIYQGAAASVFLVEVRTDTSVVAIGSAFLIDGGRIVTNAHVIRGGRPFLKTGAVALPLILQRLDPVQDLAVLRTETPLEAVPLRLSASDPPIGTAIFAIGNPQGLERSISEGIISGARVREGRRLLQLTAPISPGSSGGPVLSKDGSVVGVTVGYLEGGQNLNFAIPASVVRSLISAPASAEDFAVALNAAKQIVGSPYTPSNDPSAWTRRTAQVREGLRAAATRASKALEFLDLARLAGDAAESELAATYATEAIRRDRSLADSARSLMLSAWEFDVWFLDSTRTSLMSQMLAVADSQIAHRPTNPEAYNFRSQVLSKMKRGAAAISSAHRAVQLADGLEQLGAYWTTYHNAVGDFGTASDDDAVFAAMTRAGQTGLYDWTAHAEHLRGRELWERAGDTYAEGYRLFPSQPVSIAAICNAGRMYAIANRTDAALETLRTCVARYATASAVDTNDVAFAHRVIAGVLIDRGVYAQAELDARQALSLAPNDAWSAYELSRALEGAQRPTEAAAAAEEALRMSDGKYSSMHFAAGSAYFDLKDWSRCARAFSKATELESKDPAAPYNAGLCLAHQGYYHDAARMMEQVLVRKPDRADRAEIQRMITEWRR